MKYSVPSEICDKFTYARTLALVCVLCITHLRRSRRHILVHLTCFIEHEHRHCSSFIHFVCFGASSIIPFLSLVYTTYASVNIFFFILVFFFKYVYVHLVRNVSQFCHVTSLPFPTCVIVYKDMYDLGENSWQSFFFTNSFPRS